MTTLTLEPYKGYIIWSYGPSPLPGRHMDWHWSLNTDHADDFNNGHGSSLDDCKQQIDMWLDMEAESQTRSQRTVDKAMIMLNHMQMAMLLNSITTTGQLLPGQQWENMQYLIERYKELYPERPL